MKSVRPKTPKRPGKAKISIKDPIEVYCRIRPLENDDDQICMKRKDEKTVVLFSPEINQNLKVIKETHYSFKQVFDEKTTQKEVFDRVALPCVRDVLQGCSGLLFTYGITSSGKTYTMSGTPQDGGLLPRCLDVIFNSIKDCQATKYIFKPDNFNGFEVQSTAEAMQDQQKELGIFSQNQKPKRREIIGDWCKRISDSTKIDSSSDVGFAVFVSYVEIYNNYLYDLLDDTPIDPKKTKNLNSKMLREDALHNMYVFGVNEREVKNVEEAIELFYRGQQRRRISHTALNTESSRSHSVFTIRVVQAPLDPQGAEILQDKKEMTVSQLSLVDLAGSERSVRTKNTGLKLREAGNINTSLMALRTCIESLRESQSQGTTRMVPYRESKLTHLFKTFFEGEGKIRMIVCVNPKADDFDETIHVMRFAEMTQDVLISQPTPISTPNISCMAPGRGRRYREAIKIAKEQGVSISDVLAPVVYNLGPDFPQLVIHTSDDESVYINLVEFLIARIARRNSFVQDLNRRNDDFRKNLVAIDKENAQLKQENTILKMDLNAREQQVRNLERKLSSDNETVEMLQKQLLEAQNQVENINRELNHREKLASEQTKEVEKIRTKMQDKLASEKDRLRRIMERRLAEKQAELERKMCFTDEKFRQLREILNADDWEYFGDIGVPLPPPSIPSTVTSESSIPEARYTKKSNLSCVPVTNNVAGASESLRTETRFSKCSPSELYSNVKLSKIGSASGNTKQTTVSASELARDGSDSAKENKFPSTSQKSLAIANPRHRKSHSSNGDVWIEHKPVGNLELNTVLQPKLKKKKSVSKLQVKDILKSDVSKYVLEHQEQDSQGDVETQLFKADVIPSAGGGAQVIFNDVEKLKQVSPPPVYNLRKRSAENLPLREVEDRCSVSVECHGLPTSKMRKK